MPWPRIPSRSAVHRLTGSMAQSGVAGPGRPWTLAVTGATGAPGRTFLSVNLALALAGEGRRVALVDADPHLGAVAVQLGLAEDRSLAYLAHEAALRPVDAQLLQRHLQRAFGIDVLAGRTGPDVGEVPAPVLESVLRLLHQRCDVVVVDAGAMDCVQAQAAVLSCQLVVWVVVPSTLGIDLLDRTLASGLAAQIRLKPCVAVLNREPRAALRQVGAALRTRYAIPVCSSVPADWRASAEAEERCRPAILGGSLVTPLRRCAAAIAEQLPQALAPRAPIGAEVAETSLEAVR